MVEFYKKLKNNNLQRNRDHFTILKSGLELAPLNMMLFDIKRRYIK